MKKYLSLILIILSISAFSQKQSLGIKGGIGFSKISKLSFDAIGFRTSFIGGVSYEYSLKNSILLGAELLYMQKGDSQEVTFVFENGGGEGDLQVHVNYLSIPIKAGYSFGGKVSFFTNVGLVPSVLIDSYSKFKDPDTILPNADASGKVDSKEFTSNFELSGLAEVGIDYGVHEHFSLTTALAYHHGITSLTTSNDPHVDLKNYGFYWTFGLKYALKQN